PADLGMGTKQNRQASD
ncbi:AMP-binding enzyme family protein, partial [Vibrio cholerae HC-50A2]